MDKPRATVPACVQVAAGHLPAEADIRVGRRHFESHTYLAQRRFEVQGMSFGSDQRSLESMRRRRLSDLIDKRHVRRAHVVVVKGRGMVRTGGPGAWNHFNENLKRTVQAIEHAA